MPSVLHVAQPADGGVAKYVQHLAIAEAADGWDVAVASPSRAPFVEVLDAHGVSHLEWEAGRTLGVSVASEAASLARLLRRSRAELVHLHSSKAGLLGRLLLRGRRATLFQPHAWSFAAVTGGMATAALAWERASARWCDTVLCVSEAERQRGVASGVSARFRVVPNGVALDVFSPAGAAARAEARAGIRIDDAPLVVCVGRLCRQKGQDLLIDAWRSVAATVPGAVLALVGDGPDRDRLERGAPAGVRFTGELGDVRPWLAACDVVVVPSRWDGMAFSLLEAMASGRSIVATDVEGAREALGEAGCIVPTDDSVALAGAVTTRLLDPALRHGEGQAARHRAQQAHDARVRLAEVMAVSVETVRAHGPH